MTTPAPRRAWFAWQTRAGRASPIVTFDAPPLQGGDHPRLLAPAIELPPQTAASAATGATSLRRLAVLYPNSEARP